MFRHVVMFKWNDDVDSAQVDAIGEALDELVATIPEVGDYRHGRDAELNDANYDYVIVAEFDSVDDFVVYRDHPDHRQLIADQIADNVRERAAVQYDAG